MSLLSVVFILTGVDESLALVFGGLKREDVRLVRTGGEPGGRAFSVALLGELMIKGSVGGGVFAWIFIII